MFVDDLEMPGMRHAAILRSPVAHARITGIDTSGVPDGVVVFGPDDLTDLGPVPILWHLDEQWQVHTPVVDSTVRYVGQPIAVVVADSRYRAEDALDEIFLDYDELPVVVDGRAALDPEAPLLYPERGSNCLARFEAGSDGATTDAVFAEADQVLSTTVDTPRLSGAPMECRGIVAHDDGDRLSVWTSNQAPHGARDTLSEVFGLPQHRIRVVAPAVGGGFGLKDHLYEDELMVVAAARRLGCPVKWIEDRSEALVATTQARHEHFEIDVAYDNDGTLLAIRVDAVRNTGAHFAIFGGGPLFTAGGTLPGPYRWKAVRTVGRLAATNRTPLGAYRGFGQTQAALVRERAVDLVAAALGRDPVELRLQNMLGPDELPHLTATFLNYDNGDYPEAMRRVASLTDAWEQPDDGRRRGVGFAFYVQMTGIGNSNANEIIGLKIGGYETSEVTMHPDGSVRVTSGISPHGQGQETTMAQLVADRLGIDINQVTLVVSDTDTSPYSAYGTAASRSITVGGGAAVLAADKVASQIRDVAADLLEAAPDDIVLAEGRATVAGTEIGVPIRDVAARAWQGFRLPGELTPGLSEQVAWDPPDGSFSYAAHACQVAVDADTGIVEVERYAVVHDCGTIVNPTIVEGQIHGGIAQGLGSTLLEAIEHNDDGQPITTTFLDYLVPDSEAIPDVEIVHMQTPSPFVPGGMKGMGEGGTNGAMVCVYNAVAAALPEVRSDLVTLPLSPSRLWEALHD